MKHKYFHKGELTRNNKKLSMLI